MTTYVITTERGTNPPANPEPFTADFVSAYETFTAEVERQLAFGPPHNHPFDSSDPDAFWEEDCLWCEDAMIWENWAGSEGLIIQSDYMGSTGEIAIGLSHTDVILRKVSD